MLKFSYNNKNCKNVYNFNNINLRVWDYIALLNSTDSEMSSIY